jgi:hypothetical protein
MELEQMMACLLAEMKTNQVKMDANLKEMKEVRAGQEHLKEEMRACQELKEEMLAKLDAHHERTMVRIGSQLRKMEACLEKMEATDLQANPEETEPESESESP